MAEEIDESQSSFVATSGAALVDTSILKSSTNLLERHYYGHNKGLHAKTDHAGYSLTYMRGERSQFRENQQIYDFACLLQFIESLVLHEEIYFVQTPSFEHMSEELRRLTGLIRHLPGAEKFVNQQISDKTTELRERKDLGAGLYRQIHRLIPSVGLENPDALKIASVYGIAYVPPPRNENKHWFDNKYLDASTYASFAEETLNKTKDKAAKEMEEINRFLNTPRFQLEVPLIANYVLKEKGHRNQDIVGITLKVRESREATAFRKICGEFDLAARVGDAKAMYKIKREIERAIDKLNKKYEQPKMELGIEFPLSISFNLSEIFASAKNKRKYHLIFIDKLYDAAIKQEGLRQAFFQEF